MDIQWPEDPHGVAQKIKSLSEKGEIYITLGRPEDLKKAAMLLDRVHARWTALEAAAPAVAEEAREVLDQLSSVLFKLGVACLRRREPAAVSILQTTEVCERKLVETASTETKNYYRRRLEDARDNLRAARRVQTAPEKSTVDTVSASGHERNQSPGPEDVAGLVQAIEDLCGRGKAHLRSGDLEGAAQVINRANGVWNVLNEKGPGQAQRLRARRVLADALHAFGVVQGRRGEHGKAETAFREEVKRREAI